MEEQANLDDYAVFWARKITQFISIGSTVVIRMNCISDNTSGFRFRVDGAVCDTCIQPICIGRPGDPE